jgi:outer membrane protein OmpA-like peptidoglycan-associated protein
LDDFNSALAARNLATLKKLENAIAAEPECDQRLITEARRKRVAVELLAAQGLRDRNGYTGEYERLIADADKIDVSWRAAVAMGELRFRQRRFAEAARAFQRALETINNRAKTPKSPNTRTIGQIFHRASEMKLLAAGSDVAPVFVAAAKGRDGTIGGTMSQNIRGFEPKVVPLPIRFETASTHFTAVGEQAASELLTALREQSPQRITLVGHTDERGGTSYNMRLSAERADAVAKFLRQNGISARIITVAKGESDPLQLSETAGLTREDIWSLNRRVEWKRE